MFVRAVAGVDDAGVEHARQKMRRAGSAVADDDEIRVKRFKIFGRVLEGLAFFERRSLGGEVDDVGGQTLLGQLEADARAVSSTVRISSAVSDSMSSRCLRFQLISFRAQLRPLLRRLQSGAWKPFLPAPSEHFCRRNPP